MSDILDLYDHEVLLILRVQRELNERAQARQHNYNDFEREIRDRFAKIGFLVNVNWHSYSVDGTEQEDSALPEVTITGRTDDRFRFDPDRQVHEAVHNVLDLPGEEGWIRTDPDTVKNFLEGNGGHSHGHGHRH